MLEGEYFAYEDDALELKIEKKLSSDLFATPLLGYYLMHQLNDTDKILTLLGKVPEKML